MSKLTKAQTKAHKEALDRLRKDKLSDDDREFIMQNYHPGATHMNGAAGAFFTPPGLANDMVIDSRGRRILDLCAGIGTLALHHWYSAQWDRDERERQEITCVEINPAYVEIGRKLLPSARWICADVFSLTPQQIGRFDVVISNPPFGQVQRSGSGPRYTGAHFDLHVVDLAAEFADRGTFILPAMSAPFRLSGQRNYQRLQSGRGVEFEQQTGAILEAGCGIDCNFHRDGWLDVAPAVEVVCADFENVKRPALAAHKPAQLSLLAAE